jgi:type I restriction enzyme S subunit
METVLDKINIEKYSTYKDSGAEWLGNIPSHWITLSNKYIFKLKKNLVGKKSGDYVLLSLTLNGVIKRDMENPQGKFPAEFNTYQEVKKGDFIFCLFDVEETPRCVGHSDYDGMITGAYTVMEPNDNFDRNYLYYFYLNLDSDKRLKPLYTGLRNTISKENFFSFKSFVPPKEEQTAIATFLDRKTSLIDQAIGIKQKQIELLKERRQILINKAVTRGLNPNVKLKNSGVEWIGEIPEHWEAKRMKYLGRIRYGLGQPPKEKESGLPLIRATNVERGKIVEKDLVFVDPEDIPWERGPELKENDIIVVRSGAYTADSAIIPKKYVGAIAGYDMVFTPLIINPLFISFALLSKYILFDQLYLLRMRAAQPHLNAEELGVTLVLYPPAEEQFFISEYIDNFSHKTATAICLKEQEIEKLKEYKATLINSAVTGKIKVS